MIIGILDRYGDFHKCDSWGHSSLSEKICTEVYGIEYFRKIYAEDYLLSQGYLYIRARDMYMSYWGEDKKPIILSDEQIKWLKRNTHKFNEEQKKDLSGILLDQNQLKNRVERLGVDYNLR